MSDTERFGDLERFAVERALHAAWVTEFWIPGDPDYGFVDYFEAAAARNLGLLSGFEELGEDINHRGIVPQCDSEQARLVTDGGTDREAYVQDVLADLHTVRGLMNDGRPLEALAHVNDSIDRLEDEIDAE